MSTQPETTDILRKLAKTYRHQHGRWTEKDWTDTYHAYHQVLADIPAELLGVAARHWAATEKWWPAAAELRDTVYSLGEWYGGMPTAEEAWAEARVLAKRRLWWVKEGESYAVRDVQESDCSHPLVFLTIERMGLRSLRGDTPEGVNRKHFWDMYRSFHQRQMSEKKMLPQVRREVARLAGQPEPVAAIEAGVEFTREIDY